MENGRKENILNIEEERRKLAEYYPRHSATELIEQGLVSISHTTIKRLVKAMGLKHDSETTERLKRKRQDRTRRPEARAKAGRSLSRKWRIEYNRMFMGLDQRTNLHLRKRTKRATASVNYLVRKYGYIETTDPDIIWYDENTVRAKNEEYFINRYKIKIYGSPSQQHQTDDSGADERIGIQH